MMPLPLNPLLNRPLRKSRDAAPRASANPGFQAKHLAFLPLLLLLGVTGVRGAFLAGAASAEIPISDAHSLSGQGSNLRVGTDETTAPQDRKPRLSSRPAHVLRRISYRLERQCQENAEHTVTLSQEEVEVLSLLAREAEARENRFLRPARTRHSVARVKPLAMHDSSAP